MICTADNFPLALENVLRYPPVLLTGAFVLALGAIVMVPFVYYVGSKMPQSIRSRLEKLGLWDKIYVSGILFMGKNHIIALRYAAATIIRYPKWIWPSFKEFDIRKEAPKNYLNLLRILGLMILIVYPVFFLIVISMAVGRVLCWLQ